MMLTPMSWTLTTRFLKSTTHRRKLAYHPLRYWAPQSTCVIDSDPGPAEMQASFFGVHGDDYNSSDSDSNENTAHGTQGYIGEKAAVEENE